MKVYLGRDPLDDARHTVAVAPHPGRGLVMAVRFGTDVLTVEPGVGAQRAHSLLVQHGDALLVLDGRLPPAIREALPPTITVDVDGPCPWPGGPFKSWRAQAGAYLVDSLRRSRLTLPNMPGLVDQVAALREVRDGGVVDVVPATLPLVDAVLLTLAPLLRRTKYGLAMVGA